MKCENFLIAVGANLASEGRSALGTCILARDILSACGWVIRDASRWRRTPAFPPGSGPDFINGALSVDGPQGATAEDALRMLHEVEAEIGRVRRERWGPRVIDLDLIAHGDRVAPDAVTVARAMAMTDDEAQAAPTDQGMILPHPRMHRRGFVLAPLADVAPGWRHPLTGRTVAEMLADLPPEDLAEIEVVDD